MTVLCRFSLGISKKVCYRLTNAIKTIHVSRSMADRDHRHECLTEWQTGRHAEYRQCCWYESVLIRGKNITEMRSAYWGGEKMPRPRSHYQQQPALNIAHGSGEAAARRHYTRRRWWMSLMIDVTARRNSITSAETDTVWWCYQSSRRHDDASETSCSAMLWYARDHCTQTISAVTITATKT